MVWRVSNRATFEVLRTQGRRARCGPVTVAFCRADEPSVARVAYTVRRKAGRAVQRNRIRRRLRAAVGEVAGELRSGAYMVWAGREVLEMPFETLRVTVARAMASAGRRPGNEDEQV